MADTDGQKLMLDRSGCSANDYILDKSLSTLIAEDAVTTSLALQRGLDPSWAAPPIRQSVGCEIRCNLWVPGHANVLPNLGLIMELQIDK